MGKPRQKQWGNASKMVGKQRSHQWPTNGKTANNDGKTTVTTTATITGRTTTKHTNQPRKQRQTQLGIRGDTNGEAKATAKSTTTGKFTATTMGKLGNNNRETMETTTVTSTGKSATKTQQPTASIKVNTTGNSWQQRWGNTVTTARKPCQLQLPLWWGTHCDNNGKSTQASKERQGKETATITEKKQQKHNNQPQKRYREDGEIRGNNSAYEDGEINGKNQQPTATMTEIKTEKQWQ